MHAQLWPGTAATVGSCGEGRQRVGGMRAQVWGASCAMRRVRRQQTAHQHTLLVREAAVRQPRPAEPGALCVAPCARSLRRRRLYLANCRRDQPQARVPAGSGREHNARRVTSPSRGRRSGLTRVLLRWRAGTMRKRSCVWVRVRMECRTRALVQPPPPPPPHTHTHKITRSGQRLPKT